MSFLKDHTKRMGKQLEQLAYRSLNQHLRVGITGLSRAGKTALITSLVHQLTHANATHLPMWQALSQRRILGVQRQPQPDLTMRPFDFDGAMAALTASPPQWPASTEGFAEIRLAIRFVPAHGVRRHLADHFTLYLDLVDYPGEWLLDLPLLELDYFSWCQQQWGWLQQTPWHDLAAPWLAKAHEINVSTEQLEANVGTLAEGYSTLLTQLRYQQGATFLQPGRALLPGDLAGTPILAFYPQAPEQYQAESPLSRMLEQRFEAYKRQVVLPFFENHFSKFDRQIVLIDALSALNQGRAQVVQMQQSLQAVLKSFHYGPGSFLRRLFSPQIDKLLFVAGKADHISIDQHSNLLALTEQLMGELGKQVRFSGASSESMVLSAIRASETGRVESDQGMVNVIRGTDMAQQPTVRFPGEVPTRLPDDGFWQQQGFDFISLAPPKGLQTDAPLPHMRMDHLIEWLIGDKT